MLNIKKSVREGDDVVIPVRLSAGTPDPGAISIETRSLFNLLQLAAARIEVPEDPAAGAVRFPTPGLPGQGVRILSSISPPGQARVAVEYRGYWYYIEQTDAASKQWLAMIQLL